MRIGRAGARPAEGIKWYAALHHGADRIGRRDMETRYGVGQSLPDVVLSALNGDPVSLATLRGKRRLLYMWGSW